MISRSRRKHRTTAPNRPAIRAATNFGGSGRLLAAAVAVLLTGAPLWAQEEEPKPLPKRNKAKPVARAKVSDSGEAASQYGSSGNELSFGKIARSRIPAEVVTAEGGDDDTETVKRAVADEPTERGMIRRVAADGEVAPVQWKASRTKSVLVNGPQDPPSSQEPGAKEQIPAQPPIDDKLKPSPGAQQRLRANCGVEAQACDAARMKVSGNSIDRIQLDISPLLFTEEEHKSLDEMVAASERLTREGLKDSPFRTWTDRSGNVIVENARLLRLKANSIIVLDAAGTQHLIPLSRLPESEMCEVADTWGVPVRCELQDELYAGRTFYPTTFTWTASALCHKPLYFEQIELERYGHTPGPILEAPMAGAKFAADLATLPYKVGINPPNECQYALGYYRPGNCAPWIIPPVPLSLRGAIFQATAVTGVSWIIP